MRSFSLDLEVEEPTGDDPARKATEVIIKAKDDDHILLSYFMIENSNIRERQAHKI